MTMETTMTVKTNFEPKCPLDTSDTSQSSVVSLASSIGGDSSIATRSILEGLCSDLSNRSLCKELRRNSSSHDEIAVLTHDKTGDFGGSNDKARNTSKRRGRGSHTSLASLDNFVSSMATLRRSRNSPASSTPARQTDPSFPAPQLVSTKNRQRKMAQRSRRPVEDDVHVPRPEIQGNEIPFRPSRRRSQSLGDEPTRVKEPRDSCATRRQSRFISEYQIGEEVRSTSDLSVDIKTIRNLNEGDGAFIRRSDGSFTFAVVKRRCVEIVSGYRESKKEILVFIVDPSRNKAKVINQKKWSSSIIGAADHVFERRNG